MSNVRDFGAVGDGEMDDSDAIQHAIDDGDGVVEFPRGDYRITRSMLVDLAMHRRTSLDGSGGTAKLLMDAPGPAIVLRGTHPGSADPTSFQPAVWQHQRMPQIANLEIEGLHEAADGIRIQGVMQPTLTGVLIRRVRTAVHVTDRARNLLVDHCHLYYNHGVGVYLENVNLHQAIISASHISYCRMGGIRIENSEIRNLQITGNDIEYNNNRVFGVPDADAEPTAEIYIDVGANGSVREGTIAGNTLQATSSPAGANIRLIGNGTGGNHRIGMWTISGNLIGSQRTNIHLTSARGVTITGNYIYSGHHRNVLVEGSRNIVLGSNCFGHNPDYRTDELATGIRFENCESCNLTGVLIEDAEAGRHTVPDVEPIVRDGLIELVNCRRMNISGTQVLDGSPVGIFLRNCRDTTITGCTILDDRDPKMMHTAIRWLGDGRGNQIAASRIGRGTQAAIEAPPHVQQSELVFDQ